MQIKTADRVQERKYKEKWGEKVVDIRVQVSCFLPVSNHSGPDLKTLRRENRKGKTMAVTKILDSDRCIHSSKAKKYLLWLLLREVFHLQMT